MGYRFGILALFFSGWGFFMFGLHYTFVTLLGDSCVQVNKTLSANATDDPVLTALMNCSASQLQVLQDVNLFILLALKPAGLPGWYK